MPFYWYKFLVETILRVFQSFVKGYSQDILLYFPEFILWNFLAAKFLHHTIWKLIPAELHFDYEPFYLQKFLSTKLSTLKVSILTDYLGFSSSFILINMGKVRQKYLLLSKRTVWQLRNSGAANMVKITKENFIFWGFIC